MNLKPLTGLIIIYCLPLFALSQEQSAFADKIINFPSSFFTKINHKTASIDARLTKHTEQYLQRLARREKKLKRKLSKIDSTAAQKLFTDSEQQYVQLKSKLMNKSPSTGGGGGKAVGYLPALDSVKTSLSFLQQNSNLLGNTNDVKQNVQGSLTNVNRVQSKLQQTEQVKTFIQQRKQQIKDALGRYTNLPKGITNSVADFNKQAYYYNAQIKEYKDLLKEPDRMVEKGLSELNKLPAFQQFMQQHSELASLFRLPDNYGSSQSLAGLQTRDQVQQQIQGQLASAGPNGQQYFQQNLQAAQSQLNQLKDKLNKSGGIGDADMPNFKPNNQKTKTFWNRLEYGSNFQTAKSNFFPVTTDLGLSVGYRLTDKRTIGVGASYKMGWGKDFRHISITHEGVGLRSYLDMKLKGSFYASGGYEFNYQPLNVALSSSSSPDGKGMAWTQSGLIGVSKVVSVKTNFFKKTKVQLLWDFLSYQQVPRTQPVKFRVGYSFRE